jgi:hypothetical protein
MISEENKTMATRLIKDGLTCEEAAENIALWRYGKAIERIEEDVKLYLDNYYREEVFKKTEK